MSTTIAAERAENVRHEQPDWPRLRDVTFLVDCGVLARNPGGGRSTSYRLVTSA